MIGTYMGKFIACVSAEEKLSHYITYMAAEVGFPVESKTGVYSSDSTPVCRSWCSGLIFCACRQRQCRTDPLPVRFKRSPVDEATAKRHRLPHHLYKPLRQRRHLPGIPHDSGEDQERAGRVSVSEAERGVKALNERTIEQNGWKRYRTNV